ncbi:MAG: phosphate starvation-inducible PhoH-like protein, partial [Cognaticolwellia sp.]
MSKNTSINVELSPADNNRLANLCGPMDDNLKTLE